MIPNVWTKACGPTNPGDPDDCESGACVEIQWRTPCGGGECVEVGQCDTGSCVQVGRCGGGDCVEVGQCEGASCVNVDHADGHWLVRDSKLGETSEVLNYPRERWAALVERIKVGQWDIDNEFFPLRFTGEERDAFAAAVKDGEFDA